MAITPPAGAGLPLISAASRRVATGRKALLCDLGLVAYERAVALEEELRRLRRDEVMPDIILLMEHPPTVTVGRFGQPANVLLSPAELTARGIAFARSSRGGDATFHAPGQLILHAVMDLRRRGGILRGFIADLEEASARALKSYGVAAGRRDHHPGLWVKGRQMGAIGLNISCGISSHGLALNIDPDLSDFRVINLCGLPGCEATSLACELGYSVDIKQAARRLAAAFAEVFRTELIPVTPMKLAGVVAGTAGL